jgi:hypothetical protein
LNADDDRETLAEALNRECFCIGTDLDALSARLAQDLAEQGLLEPVLQSHPHLFSTLPVFVSREQVARMQSIVTAVETVIATAGYRAEALGDAPEIARHAPAHAGVLMGYDFHLGPRGPQLIEINTNAGGALLNAVLARAQRACCPEVETLLSSATGSASPEDAILADFREEWARARPTQRLEHIAIVDQDPPTQYLYPEFLLFQRLFASHGIDAVVADPRALEFAGRELRHDGRRVDLVYNRLTDFYLEDAANRSVRLAFERDVAVVTPHPHAHALHANKRNLVRLTDAARLGAWGVDAATIDVVLAGVPETRLVCAADADRLWSERKGWFFKPARGFGSRGSYRGDKITRRAFADVLAGDYVAQRLAPPSERVAEGPAALKVDFRTYVYRGRIRMLAARLYQGQTTNFRTPGGGFAPVFYAGD